MPTIREALAASINVYTDGEDDAAGTFFQDMEKVQEEVPVAVRVANPRSAFVSHVRGGGHAPLPVDRPPPSESQPTRAEVLTVAYGKLMQQMRSAVEVLDAHMPLAQKIAAVNDVVKSLNDETAGWKALIDANLVTPYDRSADGILGDFMDVREKLFRANEAGGDTEKNHQLWMFTHHLPPMLEEAIFNAVLLRNDASLQRLRRLLQSAADYRRQLHLSDVRKDTAAFRNASKMTDAAGRAIRDIQSTSPKEAARYLGRSEEAERVRAYDRSEGPHKFLPLPFIGGAAEGVKRKYTE